MISQHSCGICHKALRKPDSVLRGIGPKCRKKTGIDNMNQGRLWQDQPVIKTLQAFEEMKRGENENSR